MTFDEIDKAIRALAAQPGFAPLIGEGKAAVVWALDPLRIIWSSQATHDLTRALILDKSGRIAPYFPGAARIEALLRGIAPREGQRLEKIRFETSALAPLATCACRLVTLPDGRDGLITHFADRIPTVRKPRMAPSLAADAEARPAADTNSAATEPSEEGRATETQPAPQPPPTVAPTRFVWEMDAQGRFTHVSPELAKAVGDEAAAICGKTLDDILDPAGDAGCAIDPKDILREIVARGETFSGRRLYWRLAGRDEAIAVDLAGLPVGQALPAPYRGFGICRPGERRPWAELLPPAAAPAMPDTAVGPADDEPAATTGADDPAPLERLARHAPFDLARAPLIPPGGVADDATPGMDDSTRTFDEPVAIAAASAQIGGKLGDPEPPPFTVAPDSAPDPADAPLAESPDAQGAPASPSRSDDDDGSVRRHAAAGLSEAERSAFREIARALAASGTPAEAVAGDDTQTRTADAHSSPAAAVPTEETAHGSTDAPGETAASLDAPSHDARAPDAPSPDAPSPDEEQEEAQDRSRVILAPANDRSPDIRAVLDRMPAGIVVHRGEEALFANRYLLDLLGHEDLASFTASGGLSRLFVARPHALDQAAQDVTAPLTIQNAAGSSIAVEIRMTTVDWRGYPASMLMLRTIAEADPTEKLRELELDLRAREERLREQATILDTAIDGVIVIDQAGRILSLNRAAEALFGYDQKEIAGESFTQLLHTESHVAALDYLDAMRGDDMRAVLNDGREVLGRVRQGGAIPLFMTLGAVGEGLERKFCAVLRDMTAFKQTETELVAARRAAEAASAQKSDFLARISHEVRTPLNAIIGFAEVMLEERFGPVGNERYRDYLADIHASGEHVISLVNDLLDLAKIEAGRLELSFTAVSLNEMVNACVALLQPQAARERIVLRTSFAENLPNLSVDERSLRQIILNLLSNAVKFTDAGGQVIVSTAKGPDGDMVFRVRDTGIGMNDTEVEAALEPFRQLATARKPGGTGLGLPLTKALVEANQGTLRISSRKDEGTLAEVVFPPARVLAR